MTSKAASAGRARKNFWLKQLHTWHWISSAVSLIGLLLFTVTGFTLNHAGDIGATPATTNTAAQLPAALLPMISSHGNDDGKRALPIPVAAWVADKFPTEAKGEAEWSAGEVYLSLPRPGGDGWISIDRTTGAVTSEITSRGWISYLNDLHKGRNAGAVWKWFIDVFAFASLVYAMTGLVLLWIHSKRRRSTWPLVTLGLAIPATIAVLFIHV